MTVFVAARWGNAEQTLLIATDGDGQEHELPLGSADGQAVINGKYETIYRARQMQRASFAERDDGGLAVSGDVVERQVPVGRRRVQSRLPIGGFI